MTMKKVKGGSMQLGSSFIDIGWLVGEANFIDYEYGCYAFRGFDIGNHFNEFAGFECEYWRYPTKEFQMKWYEWYLTENNNGGRFKVAE